MDYLHLEKFNDVADKNWQMHLKLTLCILYSENKVNIDYKENV